MTLTLADIPNDLDAELRRKAAEQHRPVDQVAFDAIRAGLGLPGRPSVSGTDGNLAEAIRARFAPLGGVELAQPIREPMRDPPDFGE